MTRYRVIRELIYEGEEEWIRRTFENSFVKPDEGLQILGQGGAISSSIKSREIIKGGEPNDQE